MRLVGGTLLKYHILFISMKTALETREHKTPSDVDRTQFFLVHNNYWLYIFTSVEEELFNIEVKSTYSLW